MLNYSAIIRTIINQYKRRKKYIFSFLLLSIIVVSAITSMLTKPAISMTNELFDQFIHLQNVKSTDITDDSSDVIPTIDNNYTDSIFRNYIPKNPQRKWNYLVSVPKARFVKQRLVLG